MTFNSWVELEANCPINISRIKRYHNDFNTLLPEKITNENLNQSKERVMSARSCLDSMIITFVQLLYDRNILIEPTDKILYAWLSDNFGRYIKKLDEDEMDFVIKFDEADPAKSMVGISRLSAYAKLLRTTADSLIYESLLKATDEYNELKATEKIKKVPRTFLYILFQVLSITLGVMGGLAREDMKGSKRGMATTMPLSWQSLMTPGGQELIKDDYTAQTGKKISKELLEQIKNLEEEAEDSDKEEPTEESEEEPEEKEEEHE